MTIDTNGARQGSDPPARVEVARPYFERQAQWGNQVVFRWNPARDWPHNPLTDPWPGAEELIEGVAFADEEAARRFDLDRLAPACDEGRVTGPYHQFDSWAEAERWLRTAQGAGC